MSGLLLVSAPAGCQCRPSVVTASSGGGGVLADVHPVVGEPAAQHRAYRETVAGHAETGEQRNDVIELAGVLEGFGERDPHRQPQRGGLLGSGDGARPGPSTTVRVVGGRAGAVQ